MSEIFDDGGSSPSQRTQTPVYKSSYDAPSGILFLACWLLAQIERHHENESGADRQPADLIAE